MVMPTRVTAAAVRPIGAEAEAVVTRIGAAPAVAP